MPYIRIWIHVVWTTHDRHPFLTKEVRSRLFDHIHDYAGTKHIHIDRINGHLEHVHCLLSLSADQTIATIMNLLKGESSHWMNKNNLTGTRFSWQNEYFAVSVSESGIDRVREYIDTQEAHHSKKTFAKEYQEFVEKYKFQV